MNQDLTGTLTPQEWDAVFQGLYQLPYGAVANLVGKLQSQLQGQVAKPAPHQDPLPEVPNA